MRYSSREVSELLGLTVSQIRRLARQGFLAPSRTPQNHFRFSFRDLTFLRTTTTLLSSPLPKQRVHRALRALRRQQPEQPLSQLRLIATDDGVLAHDGDQAWYPESGQVLFGFAVPGVGGAPIPFEPFATSRSGGAGVARAEADAWYHHGRLLEAEHDAEARQAYRRALALNPSHHDARVQLGQLLFTLGRRDDAIEHYRIVLEEAPDHASAAFWLGAAFEDTDRPHEAFTAYAQALAADPNLAEAHYNIARLYEQAGDQLGAVRHLRAYRDLVREN